MGTKCCKAAPVPGETKVWQYVTLTKKIYMIDSPGVVYDVGDSEVETVLKGVVRSERLKDPCDFVGPMLSRLNPKHVEKIYTIKTWADDIDFLNQLARFKGKLLPNGEPDIGTVAKIMINDWQRGKLPYFVAPPRTADDKDTDNNNTDDIAVPEGLDENGLVPLEDREDEEEEDEEEEEDREAVEIDADLDEEDGVEELEEVEFEAAAEGEEEGEEEESEGDDEE